MPRNKYEDLSDALNKPLLDDTDSESTNSESSRHPNISEVLKDSEYQPILTIREALSTDYEGDGPDSVFNYIINVIKEVNSDLARKTRRDIGFTTKTLQSLVDKLESFAYDTENQNVDIKKVIRTELFKLRQNSSLAINEMFWTNVQSLLNEKIKFQPQNSTVYKYDSNLLEIKRSGFFSKSNEVTRYDAYHMKDRFQMRRVSDEKNQVEKSIDKTINSQASDEEDNSMRGPR